MAESFMNRGELVPDKLAVDIIKEKLVESDKQGTVLDGFPRTVAQADALQEALSELSRKIDAVIDVEVDEEELVRRLTRRRTCSNCGRNYHLDFDPPKRDEVCDVCGGKLYQRDDDKEETVKNRLKVYAEQTAPLIDYYRRAGLLRTVDGKASIDEVFSRIESALGVVCE
jgi:adenylate kinase